MSKINIINAKKISNKFKIVGSLVGIAALGITMSACNPGCKTSKNNNVAIEATKKPLPSPTICPNDNSNVKNNEKSADNNITDNKVNNDIINETKDNINETKDVTINKTEIEMALDNILIANQSRGANAVDMDMLKDTFFLTNIDELTKEEITEMYPNGLDIDKVINNACSYYSIVTTHNIKNNNNTRYIQIATLCASDTDKQIIKALSYKYLENQKNIDANTLTSEKFHKSFEEITQFYLGNKAIIDGQTYYDNLSSGAQALAESMWPMFNIQFMTNPNLTAKEEKLLIYLTQNEVDGHKFMGRFKSFNIDKCKTK